MTLSDPNVDFKVTISGTRNISKMIHDIAIVTMTD